MAKIITLDPSRRPLHRETSPAARCDHKNVVAYTSSRTVHCAICGTELDPFEVMLKLLKGCTPPGDNNRDLKLYKREVERRNRQEPPKRK